jgi:hypothetical protein
LERCAYSDFVFVETMHKAGYVSKGGEYPRRNSALDSMIVGGGSASPSAAAATTGFNKLCITLSRHFFPGCHF